jgi:four helix bundle protein
MTKKIERFEDLIAWQKARIVVAQIYKVTNLPRFSRDFGLANQIRRAAVSVLSNIAEGFERGGLSEFHQFLVIAKGSCAEVRAQLYVAFDAGYIEQEEFFALYEKVGEAGRIIGGLRAAVNRKRRSED